MYNRTLYYKWNKKDYLEIIKMWNKHSAPEIAEKLGVPTLKIHSIVCYLRKNGIPLKRKDRRGVRVEMLQEIKEQLKIK
jgi:biotin operon repressor